VIGGRYKVRRHMEIIIFDIPEEGQDLSFNVAKHEWFARIVKEALGEAFEDNDTAKLKLHLDRFEEEVDIKGEFRASYHPACDRCLGRTDDELIIPIHAHLTPLFENDRQRERETDEGTDLGAIKEDLDFSYYEGDRFHLDDFINEQIVLARPMKHLCSENCKGLCPRCGANLNEETCQCKEERMDPRWDALKDVVIRKR